MDEDAEVVSVSLPATYVRRIRINDVIHSFCWLCRELGAEEAAKLPPFVILGYENHATYIQSPCKPLVGTSGEVLRPFVAYLLNQLARFDRMSFGRTVWPVWMLERHSEDWSRQEWDYAVALLRRYYGQS